MAFVDLVGRGIAGERSALRRENGNLRFLDPSVFLKYSSRAGRQHESLQPRERDIRKLYKKPEGRSCSPVISPHRRPHDLWNRTARNSQTVYSPLAGDEADDLNSFCRRGRGKFDFVADLVVLRSALPMGEWWGG